MGRCTEEGFYMPTEEELEADRKRREIIKKAKADEMLVDNYVRDVIKRNTFKGAPKNKHGILHTKTKTC